MLALAAYGLLLGNFVGAYAGGADSSGYLNNARLLREGRFKVERHAIEGLPPEALPPSAYVPLGFTPVGDREMVPTYPIGLSLLMVGISSVTGWEYAPHATMWLHGMAGVVLLFLISRGFGLGIGASATGALLLGVSPLYLFMTLQAMSDVPAMVWCTGTIYCAWQSRTRVSWAFAAGAAMAMAVLVRPTNILMLVPVALCLGWSWQRWLALAIGGAPGAVFLALFNHALYGKVVTTGYGNISSSFSRDFLAPVLGNYLHWLPVLLTPGLVLLLLMPWAMARRHRHVFFVTVLWIGVITGFYAFYFHTQETWWYLRFILPAFPPLILAMLFAARALAARWPSGLRDTVTGLLACGIIGWSGYWIDYLHALKPGQEGGEKAYVDAAEWARAQLPANAVIFCMQASGAFFYYTDFVLVRWDQRGFNLLPKVSDACVAAGRPLYAVLFPFETSEALEKEIPGHWTQVGAMRHIAFWRFDGLEPHTASPVPWHYLNSTKIGSTEFTIRTGEGWFNVEQSASHIWSWSRGRGQLDIDTRPAVNGHARLEFASRSLVPRTITVKQGNNTLWHGSVESRRASIELHFEIKEGRARLEFSTDKPGTRESSEVNARELTFAVFDPKLTLIDDSRGHP